MSGDRNTILPTQNTNIFELKVNILQKTLQESVKSQLENAALQYGADRIVREFGCHDRFTL